MILTVAIASAAASANPVDDQAVKTTMGCVLHSIGAADLAANSGKELTDLGLESVSSPPQSVVQPVQDSTPANWGAPRYTRAIGNGQYWAIGFPTGNCLVSLRSDKLSSLRSGVEFAFGDGTPWRKLPATEQAQERYGMHVDSPEGSARDLVANVITAAFAPNDHLIVVTLEQASGTE